jgi:hypothetical protein
LTIKHLAYRIANDSKLGHASLAEAMGVKAQTLTNCLNVNANTHNLNISNFELLAEFSNGNLAVAEYFAGKVNAVVVPLPEIPDESDIGLLDGYMAVIKEMGELAVKFQEAYADSNISQKELEAIDAEFADVQSKLLAFQSQIKRVAR